MMETVAVIFQACNIAKVAVLVHAMDIVTYTY